MEIDNDNLEKALSGGRTEETGPQMSKEMEIGFHQGALNTLASERIELLKIVQNVEKIMGMHIGRLEELGVRIQTQEQQ